MIILAANLMEFPLSDMNLCGFPILAVNLFRDLINEIADKLVTISRCMHRVTQHVYKHLRGCAGNGERFASVKHAMI
jgi:hypothetical protein